MLKIYEKEISKKSHGLIILDPNEDFNDLKKVVRIRHINPILKNHNEHEFDMRLDYYIFGSFLCPICNPELTSSYGKEVFRNMYKDEILYEDQLINDIEVDFILKDNKTCLKYFGLEYFQNHKHYNQLANQIISSFESDNKYDLIIMDYIDLMEQNII